MKERQTAALKMGDKKPLRPNWPDGVPGRARVKAAAATGYGHETLRRIDVVVEATENEPQKVAAVAEPYSHALTQNRSA